MVNIMVMVDENKRIMCKPIRCISAEYLASDRTLKMP